MNRRDLVLDLSQFLIFLDFYFTGKGAGKGYDITESGDDSERVGQGGEWAMAGIGTNNNAQSDAQRAAYLGTNQDAEEMYRH